MLIRKKRKNNMEYEIKKDSDGKVFTIHVRDKKIKNIL